MRFKHACNICGGAVTPLLQLDAVPPLQNRFFATREDAQGFATTEVGFLWCAACQHVSIRKAHEVEFDHHYDNRQTASPFVLALYQSILSDIEQQIPSRQARVVEIGCGRGELLEMLRRSGYKDLRGFDPAAPMATDLVSNVHWDGDTHGRGADLILARHTLEEIPEPHAFVGLMASALNPGGSVYCEITNAPHLLGDADIFALYPEYSNLFSALSLARLYAANGLSVEKVTRINDGEWLGVWGRKNQALGVESAAGHIAALHKQLLALPGPVVLWGAAGRGGNILAFLQLGLNAIEFVVDLNADKHGLYIPPYGQKVISPDQLAGVGAKTILVASRKYKDEVSRMTPAGCAVVAIGDL